MLLTPREQERLLIYLAGNLARERRARGVKLNHPEALALISSHVLEAARDGQSVEELMVSGSLLIHRDEVMEGVAELLSEVQIEATFPDGTKLVTIHDPIKIRSHLDKFNSPDTMDTENSQPISHEVKPGEYLIEEGELDLLADRPVTLLEVHHKGDRPIQVGSHYHFYESNKFLVFDRQKAYGKRLAIPAGTAIRFEPGDEKTVSLVEFSGLKKIYGHRGLVQGDLK
jgi:urease subunit gamma/beta